MRTTPKATTADSKAPAMLAEFRKTNELTMGAAAALLGTTWDTWRRWEKGLNKPTIDMALRLADVCGVPVDAWRDAARPIVKVA